jgi:hypothetical protein
MRWPILALCLLLAATALPATAVGPLDNDAGSGRDAGDVSALAVPVAPGSFTGTVRLGVDMFDWYSFPAAQGQLLHVHLASLGGGPVHLELFGPATGTPMQPLDGGLDYAGTTLSPDVDFIILETGTWFFRVNPVAAASPQAASAPYRVTWSLTTPATSQVLVSAGTWEAIEARIPTATDLVAYLRMEYDTNTDHAYLGNLYEEIQPGFPFAFGVLGDATGNTLSVRPSPIPDTALPVVSAGNGGQGQSLGPVVLHGFSGPLRLTAVNSLPRVRLVLAVAALAPGTVATATGTGSLVWEEANRDVPNRVVTPVLTKEDGGDLRLSTALRFLGAFYTGTGGGSATDPSGASVPLFASCGCTTSDPWAPWTPGDWTFHVGAALTVGSPNEHLYVGGFYVPALGVY